jgi:transcriptional regulator with XRE-family HTH domain
LKTTGTVPVIASWTKRLLDKLRRKEYRDEYTAEHVRTGIAYQIRALREQRGMRQGELAAALRKPQSVVNRLEDPDYGRMSISTLLEVASAFDVALSVRYVSYPEFLRLNEHVSPDAMQVASFDLSQFDVPQPPQQQPSVADFGVSSGMQQSGLLTQHIVPNVQAIPMPGNFIALSAVAHFGVGPVVQTTFPVSDSIESAIAKRDRIIAEQKAEIARLSAELQHRTTGNVVGGMPTDVVALALKQKIGWGSSEIP